VKGLYNWAYNDEHDIAKESQHDIFWQFGSIQRIMTEDDKGRNEFISTAERVVRLRQLCNQKQKWSLHDIH